MVYKITVKLICIAIFLLCTCYVYPESIPQEQDRTLKIAEIKSFLAEYDPQDINANPPEELKAALTQLKDTYEELLGEESPTPAMQKEKLMKIYNSNDSDFMRYAAYVQMTIKDEPAYVKGIEKKEAISLLGQGLKDPDVKIRLWAATVLNGYKQKFTLSEEGYKEGYGKEKDVIDDLDKEAQILFDKARESDPIIRRFLAYPEKFKDKKNVSEMEYSSEVLKDSDAGVRFFALMGILMERMGASIVDLPIFSFIVDAANDKDALIRLFALTTLRTEDKFGVRENKIFSESLESFFKEIKVTDLFYYLSGTSVSIETMPDKEVLTRVFNSGSLIKRALLFQLLRNSIKGN